MTKELYNKKLANEWIDWVEKSNPDGTREQEMYPFIKKWIEKLKPNNLLDLGCGQGSCSELLDDNIQYIGIDGSPTLIERAKKLYSSKNKEFEVGDIYDIPLENNSIDAIMSIWVWSHLENLTLAAQEMYKLLKTNGKFLIITANPETYEERKTFYKHYSIEDNLLTGSFDLGGGKMLTDTTLYLHSREEIEKAIKVSGFNIMSVKRMGQSESSDKGLYLVIEGSK